MEMAKQEVSLEGIPQHIQDSVAVLEKLLKKLVRDVDQDKDANWRHEQRINKIGSTLKVLSQEGRQWAKLAKESVGTMSQAEKRQACVTFLQRLPKGDRLKAYEALVAGESERVGGINLQLLPDPESPPEAA